MTNIKKQYTITPCEEDSRIATITKYEDGKKVSSFNFLYCDVNEIAEEANADGYINSLNIGFLEEKISMYKRIINDLRNQITEAVRSGNYIID